MGDAGRIFGNRFQATRVLRRARDITTYHGRDLHRDAEVVIRTTPAEGFGMTARVRLEYEAAVLDEHGDSVIRGAVRTGVESDVVYCVRPFVAGITLAERLGHGPLAVEDAIGLGISVLSSLARIHPHGVMHRDIRPSNIILVDSRSDRAQLVDYGLIRDPRRGDAIGRPSLQAAEHLSPEQSGLIDATLDARSDLYSVGVTLYESLARRPPFVGQTVGDVLRQHLTARPTPLARLVPGISRGLESIIERLFHRDPRGRYQTAAGALADLEELAAARAAGREEPDIVVGARDLRRTLTEPALIGRAKELARLGNAVLEARSGEGGLILLEGESGRGKTWVLGELERRAIGLGARVLHGHGLSRVAQRPYQVLSEVVHELISQNELEPEWGRAIAEALGPFAAAARASLPELAAILPDEGTASLGLEAHGETRSITALSALLDAIGEPQRPVAILLDDGQWSDEATLRLLERWQRRPGMRRRHLVIVLAYRPEDVGEDHPLGALRPSDTLRLAELGAEEVRQQLASMAGRLPEEAVEAVLDHAGGNPFLVSATLQGMVEVGALKSGASGWELMPHRLAKLRASTEAAPVLALRLTRLGERPRRLLSVAAVLGRNFDPVLAGALAGLEPREAMRIAEDCRGRLVWVNGAGTAFCFIHDTIRDALASSLSEDDRRSIHCRAAELIEATDPDRVYELAYHFDAAGDPARALPFAIAAAEQARGQFALDLADRYYHIAARGLAAADPATRLLIHRGLGDVLTLRSRYSQAVDHYRQALGVATSRRARAEIEQRWSQLEMKRGDMRAACEHAEGALRLMGYRVPRSRLSLVPWTLWEAGIQVLHSTFPRAFVRRRKGGDDERERFAIDVYHALNGPYFFSRGVMWAGWAHLRLINLAERYPGSRALGRAYAAHAVSLNAFPRLFERGLRLSKEGADLCERRGDLWGQAQGLTFHAMMLYYLGDFSRAVEVGRRASQLFDQTGDRWEANSGLDFAVDALVRMGDLRGAVDQAREIWRRGMAIGDSHALAWSLDAWSRATGGRIPRELVDVARSRARDLQTRVAVAQADGVRLIGEGRLDEAAAVLEEARRLTMKEGFFYELNTPVLTYLTTARRMQAERASVWAPRQRQRRIARARQVAEHTLSVARKFRFNLPHALREAALLAAMSDEPAEARARINESIALAREQGQRYELAQSRVVRAELASALGWPTHGDELAGARAEQAAIEAAAHSAAGPPDEAEGTTRVTLSLIDRFDAILEGGRDVATALTAEAVYSQTRRAALRLLRGERCAVLERSPVGDDFELIPAHGDIGVAASKGVVHRAFETGRTVALSAAEALEDETSRWSGTRSIVCIPIRVRGAPRACLYVTHGSIGDLFGDDELRIGDFLGTAAGAALENAEGFRRLEDLSHELEARVERRTAELATANQELTESLRRVQEAQGQLVHAGKMAAVGTLVAGLSHELNNPLGVVLGYVQVLLRQIPDDTPIREPLLVIERQALRCSRLAKALLEFSRTKPATSIRTDPATVCASVVELALAEARGHAVELREQLPSSPLPEIVVSTHELESALINLVSNALDATPAGGTVLVEAHAETRDEIPGVTFAVSDTGSGIPSTVLPHIFDPFFTTKPVGAGTGLGLSITHQIVTTHGGKIDVKTAEETGTTITIWIPLDSDEPEAARAGKERSPGSGDGVGRQEPRQPS